MENQTKFHNCVKILRLLPISDFDKNINAISNLIYEEDELLNEFLQKCDIKIEINKGEDEFIKSEYNRDGDSYRSPNTNKYYPPSEDSVFPSQRLRDFEIKLNKIFNIYTKQYYSQAICSVYVWALGESISDGFGVAILIKNIINIEKDINQAIWDSINVVNVMYQSDNDVIKKVTYKLTSTVNLIMNIKHNICGDINLSGSLTKQVNYIYSDSRNPYL